MIKYLDIRGIEVVNVKGKLIGTVEDCIIDFKTKRIYSAILTKKSIINRWYIITPDNIKSFKDVIICDENIYEINKNILVNNKKHMVNYYMNLDIINKNGKKIGNLIDIFFNENNGTLLALVCSRGFFDDIFNGRVVIIIDNNIVFGNDKIIINENNIDFTSNISFKKIFKKG